MKFGVSASLSMEELVRSFDPTLPERLTKDRMFRNLAANLMRYFEKHIEIGKRVDWNSLEYRLDIYAFTSAELEEYVGWRIKEQEKANGKNTTAP